MIASYSSRPCEGELATAAVVGALDPGHDGDPQLFAGGPGLAVQDVALEEGEEGLHGGGQRPVIWWK